MRIAILALSGLLASPLVAEPLPRVSETPFAPFLTAQAFTCGRTCGQMRSCAEACHALLVCGDRARDGDNDGIPCESLCSAPC
ncbi:excalibur calcium-binding domain-containing protein [Palleronia abyssalis]|uniref:Excalibur calcium-binding domain-containing protein n=1 Tax=Palleronia abyssalis TaxID=1501240 RepID=A0A2R8BQA1_9RHOB|nr:excalibur calcium-binding domain-containing protein [Palleronia abyssalis]SPJ22266.1 hypothetical protein PAA8504_00054 [Palleronia abyssalis]